MTTALTRIYEPRGAAFDIFKCREPEVVISGPAGTGKSRACLEKLHAVCLNNPEVRVLALRKTMASFVGAGLVTYEQHVAADSLRWGHVVKFGGGMGGPLQFRYSNGSTITIGGIDKASKIMSTEFDMIYVQEAVELSENDWESLSTRLRNGKISFQQIIADTNPAGPAHWLKRRADRGQTVMLYGHHEDNPILFNDDGTMTDEGQQYVGVVLDNLTGVRKQRLRYGRWVAAEGIIYSEYDPGINLVNKPKEPPDEWTRYWSVDFGHTNALVIQCWAVDPDGRAFRYRELYHTKLLIEDAAKIMLRAVTHRDGTWKEPKPRAIICDWDAEDRGTLERHLHMATTLARKTVSDGIQATQSRWRPALDGRPRLFYVRDALMQRDQALVDAGLPTCSEEEIGGYVWNEAKDAPEKKDDHGMDATRYLVAHLDLQGRTRIRVSQR